MKEINLLPKTRQDELNYQAILGNLYLVIWLTLASFALVFLAQFGVKLYLERESRLISAKNVLLKRQINKEENALVKDKVQKINDYIFDFQTLATAAPKWSRVIKAFSLLPPKDIRINTFSVDEAQKRIYITGFSPTRELVLEFYEKISGDEAHFYNMEKYLENISKPADISFHIDFQVKDELLK